MALNASGLSTIIYRETQMVNLIHTRVFLPLIIWMHWFFFPHGPLSHPFYFYSKIDRFHFRRSFIALSHWMRVNKASITAHDLRESTSHKHTPNQHQHAHLQHSDSSTSTVSSCSYPPGSTSSSVQTCSSASCQLPQSPPRRYHH